MRYLTIICTLALVACFTATVKADVENVKVSGDAEVRLIKREQGDLLKQQEANQIAGADDSWYDSTVRLQIDAELSDDVAACIRLINERDWDATNSGATENVELDLGYMTLDNMFGYPVKATIGRQEILIGEGFLVGDGFNQVVDTQAGADYDLVIGKSSRRAFDAVRLTYTLEPYTVDVFTAKIDEDFGQTNVDDIDLNGINLNYDYLDIATFDLGYFVMDDRAGPGLADTGLTIRALSLRGEGSVPVVPGLTVKGEYVTEDGDSFPTNTRGTKDIDANAWYLGAEYAFQDMVYEPYISTTYVFMSGDKDANTPGNDDEQFDPLCEDKEWGVLVENLTLPGTVDDELQTNLNAWKIGAGLKLDPVVEGLSLDIAYLMADKDEAAAGVSDDIGDELDVTLTYDYTEDVQFGLQAAWFDAGKYFTDTYGAVYKEDASQIIGSVKVSF